MSKLSLLLLFTVLISAAQAAQNEISIHNGLFVIPVPAEWVIIGHNPSGNRTALAFQILGNKAEEGTQDSTNLAITTFYLKDTESMLAFIGELSSKAGKGDKDYEVQRWSVRDWRDKQGDTDYRILDARITHERLAVGVHVRLAWPLLAGNPKDYDDRMTNLLKELLKTIGTRNPDKAEPARPPNPRQSSGR